MSNRHAYVVHLSPKDVPLSEASETRSFELELDADLSSDEKHSSAVSHILDTEVIDPWSFRNHWEIASIVRPDPADRLREALRDCQTTRNPAEDEVPYTLYVSHDTNGHQQLTTLTVDRGLRAEVRDFTDELLSNVPDGQTVKLYGVHDAMIRTVAALDPSLTTMLDSHPKQAHFEFLDIVLSNKDEVRDRV